MALLESEPEPLVVGLLWHSLDSGNLGVRALTLAQIAIIDGAAATIGRKVQYRIIGWKGSNGTLGQRPERVLTTVAVDARRALGLDSTLIRELSMCDLVFDIGEGDSFADIYGLKRFAYLSLTKIWVLVLRRPLIISPQTIGPFTNRLARWTANRLLSRCARVFVRDDLSANYLVRENPVLGLLRTTDVAFMLPYLPTAEGVHGDEIRVGINVSGLLYNGGYARNNQFGLTVDYPDLMHSIIKKLLSERDCRVYLVSHVVSPQLPADDDYAVAVGLSKRFPDVEIVPPFRGPSEAKSFIATLDFFVGARMHACIAAVSAGVPTVALAYSRKFSGLFSSIGYDAVADCTAESEREVLDRVFQAFADRLLLKDAATRAEAVALERLDRYQQAVAELLKECDARKTHS